ncbi:M13 family metallopeptidase [Chitinimonas sp. BJYL2]|uniref:M13 family metallopeptidase n=1 Tax=Chitinimonas sp. BJYL2 TaxID=2976696 RepID=UPI0022B4932E|nr:M13 family metallopeptidase [Chitinimonas sp. BJYL2]
MQLKHLAFAIALALPMATMAAPKSGIDKQNFDKSVRIQDDLYAAVNGGWERKTEIPADKASWGAFHELRDLSEKRTREIIEGAAKLKGHEAKQVADFYASFMDAAKVEERGVMPLKPMLSNFARVPDTAEMTKLWGNLQQMGIPLPFVFFVDQDSKDSTRYQLQVYQSGLGLPDRDYYLEKDERFAKARDAYREYLKTLLTLSGIARDDADARADSVMALETKLATAQWSKVDNRNPEKTYNKYDREGLKTFAPGIDWDALLKASLAGDVSDINIYQPSYITEVGLLMSSEPIATWRDYLSIRALDRHAPHLSKAFVDAHFNFHEKTIAGAKELRPRWKRGVEVVENNLGEAIGKLYVEKHFPAASKKKMEVLVSNLMKAFDESIDNLAWMSPETRKQAKVKLANYGVKIGYPNKWRDYSGLQVRADDLVGNVVRGSIFEYRERIGRIGKPIDREEWLMTPQTVNAYYNPSMNEIVFPAAILQPPFFDPKADDAVNYGGIGAVIGHEISHGFDDQGSQFDAHGNLKNWWVDSDRTAFSNLTEKLVAQYAKYEPIAGRFVNGKLTLGENIADLSGLQIAHKAYRLSLGGKPAPVLDGFTGDQRFFIGFAQVWRNKTREERLLQLLTTDPHSPAHVRPVGAAVNSDAFVSAFGVKEGDGMFKPENERIRIW